MMMKAMWILEFLVFAVSVSYDCTMKALANASATDAGELQKMHNRRLMIGGVEDSHDYYMECKASDIGLAQAAGNPLPNGIPTFLVEIFSTCQSWCGISDVHVSCGAFASVKMVNPKVFSRLAMDDCLVNDGQPIKSGQIFSFTYANSFMYPMKVVSASTC